MRVLVTRPQPGADATAARLRALGHDAEVLPLLATESIDWALPATLPEAVMLTSAASVRHAGPGADVLRHLPAHCVGTATAAAARAAGWQDVHQGPGTAQALLDTLAGRVLHLAGEDRTAVTPPPELTLDIRTVYRACLMAMPALPGADLVLLYSARTARHFAAEWDRLGGRRGDIAVLGISCQALAAAGTGWRLARAAPAPTEDALLAALPGIA